MVGLVLGTLGGGGSIFSVPILVYLFSLDIPTASAYSLFIVGITSLTGSVLKYHTKMVNLRICCTFGIPSVIAIFSTRNWIIPAIPDLVLQIGSFQFTKRGLILGLFAILMILASISLITKRDHRKIVEGQSANVYLILLGAIIGLLTGMVGAGGGFLIIPVLVYLTDLRFKEAVGTTLAIITLNSLIGFLGDVINYSINWAFLVMMASLAVLGIVAAGKITKRFSNNALRTALGCIVLCMGIFILIKEVLL